VNARPTACRRCRWPRTSAITTRSTARHGVADRAAPTRSRHRDQESGGTPLGREEGTPLGREGTPQEVANVALFLASDESSFVTGDRIFCAGGRYM
jgi:NAD(P)-dependent dehydrogenase (short-subunit alcohol dehydrogenase family)